MKTLVKLALVAAIVTLAGSASADDATGGGVNLTPDPATRFVLPVAPEADEPLGTIQGLVFTDDTIGVVLGVDGGLATTNIAGAASAIQWMCQNGGEQALAFPSAADQQLLFWFQDGVLKVAGAEDSGIAGSATASFADWTLPGYGYLPYIWEQRATEYAMKTEFTEAHFGALNMTLCKGETVLLTPQRLIGWHGADKDMVLGTMERNFGQFEAYVLQVDSLMYIVPIVTDLGTCGQTCALPRLVVWHLHRDSASAPARTTYRAPAAPAPQSQPAHPNLGELPTIVCRDCN